MATHTALDSSTLPGIAKHYHGDLILGEPIMAGHNNSNYYATFSNDTGPGIPVVLTIHEPPEVAPSGRDIKNSKTLIDFILFLSQQGQREDEISFPQLLKGDNLYCQTRFGRVDKCVTIAHRIDGKAIIPQEGEAFSASQCFQVGMFLGQYHQISANYLKPESVANPYSIDRLQSLLSQYQNARAYSKTAEALQYITKNWDKKTIYLPKGIVHGDLFPENILKTKDDYTFIIDFSDAGYAPLLYDAGVVAFAFAKTSGQFDSKKANAVLQGYCTSMEISPLRNMQYKEIFPFMIQTAAVRFAVSRLKHEAMGANLSPEAALDVFDSVVKQLLQPAKMTI